MDERPRSIKVNRAAYKRRHILLIDGRLFWVVIPLFVFGLIGAFFDMRMIWCCGASLLVWFVGAILWKVDPWLLNRAWIEVNSPRGGPAIGKKP